MSANAGSRICSALAVFVGLALPPFASAATWAQQYQVLTLGNFAGFGGAVAIQGNTAVIGAYSIAFVYVNSGGVWTLQGQLAVSGSTPYFGTTVAVNGNTVVVGDWDATINSHTAQGTAYVFTRSGTSWTMTQQLTAADGATNDSFGLSIAMSSSTIMIGAPLHGAEGATGAVYAYDLVGNTWALQQEIRSPAGGAADGNNGEFGRSISLNGNTAVIGAPGVSVGSNGGQGCVFVFMLGGIWAEQGPALVSSDGAAADFFGASVAWSGNNIVIGSPYKTISGHTGQGEAYLFAASGSTWTQATTWVAPDGTSGDNFGQSVAATGAIALIGAPGKNSFQGAVYQFVNNSGTWTLQPALGLEGALQPAFTANDGAANLGLTRDLFGQAVAIDGNTALMGTASTVVYPSSTPVAQNVEYAYTVGANSLLIGSAGGTFNQALNYSGSWTAVSNSPFLNTTASGTGSGYFQFECDPFTGTGTRTGTMTIAGMTVSVTQVGTNYIGPGGAVTLSSTYIEVPLGMAIAPSGNLYVSYAGPAGGVSEWNSATQQLTLVAGVLSPAGVAVDALNNLWIADSSNSRIGEWIAGQGFTGPVAPIDSELTGIAVDGSGNVWVATPTSLEECSACATNLSAVVVVSGAFENPENFATGLAVDSFGDVFAADIGANTVWECPVCAPGGSLVTVAAPTSPRDVAVDGSGNIFIANGTLLEWSSQTRGITTVHPPRSRDSGDRRRRY